MRKKGKTGVALLMAGVLLFTNSGFVYGTELESPVQLEESELQPEEEGTEEILTEEIEKETEEELEQPEEKEILDVNDEPEEINISEEISDIKLQRNIEEEDSSSKLQAEVPEKAETSEKEATIAEGSCGESIAWKLDTDWTLIISGTGIMDNYTYEETPWKEYNYDIKNIRIEYGVQNIGAEAFMECYGVKTVDIPESIAVIGRDAFYRCTSLEKIVIPESVTKIGSSAFASCLSLEEAEINGKLEVLEGSVFSGCISLETVILPEGLTEIGGSAFQNCNRMVNINIPTSVKAIGGGAFEECESLESIDIPEGVTEISGSLCYECSSLKEVSVPKSVNKIESDAFYECSSLENVVIPEGVTEIKMATFYGCEKLKTVSLPNTLKSIALQAFGECHSLKSVTIPSSVRYIEEWAFMLSTNLEELTIEEGVVYIDDQAFDGCNLKKIFMEGDAPKTGKSVFGNYLSKTVLYIPENAEGYDTTPWTNMQIVFQNSTEVVKRKFQNKVTEVAVSQSNKNVTVKWGKIDNAKSYRIYRKESNGNFAGLATVKGDVTSYVDRTAQGGKTYYYTVKGFWETGAKGVATKYPSHVKIYIPFTETEFSNWTPAITTTISLDKGVTVKWERINDARSYRIYRKEAGGSFEGIANVKANVDFYTDQTIKAGKTYYYTVKGFWEENAKGTASKYKTSSSASYEQIVPVVSTKSVNYCNIDISWKKAEGAKKYVIYRKEAKKGTSFKSIKTVAGNALNYRDNTAKMGVNYYYTVKAYAGSVASGYQKNVTGMAVPSAPILRRVLYFANSNTHKRGLRIRWTGSKAGSNQFVDGYRIFRKTAGGSWKTIGTVGKNVRSFDDSTGKIGTTYYYTVRPYVKLSNGTNLWGSYDKNGVYTTR